MSYYLGENRELVSQEEFIGDGEEGNVYKFKTEAVKIYYNNWQNSYHAYLSLEDVLRMSKMRSNHILLPRRIVYNENDEFCGYSTRYKRDPYKYSYDKQIDVIDNMLINSVISMIEKVYKDMYYLSSKGLVITDRDSIENYVFNGEFWLIDPGTYYFSDEDIKIVEEENLKTLNSFFLDYCFLLGKDFELVCGMEEPEKLGYTICDFIREHSSYFEKTLSFRKRM